MFISKRRQQELLTEQAVAQARTCWRHAARRVGADRVLREPSHAWDSRCMLGMHDVLPFKATMFQTLSELLFVVRSKQDEWAKEEL